ncbi:TGS domain-containing protein, partial [Candidatus Bathyarchaeota archaeon]|nr:TGS domain-containing protein [Candidatus Bathyarchaeota archaeon]
AIIRPGRLDRLIHVPVPDKAGAQKIFEIHTKKMKLDRNINLDKLKEAIYNRLNFIRIYLKPRNGEPDFKEPLILTAGSTVSHVCAKIHRKFAEEAKYALVSGTSVKFSPQRVRMDHVIHDRDIVTIVT